ncbi:MAG: hypothetical protein WC365_01400 [Candidatus Babeliales bacterium]|jgi:uncharacterized Zn-binding protein involved in type VI secretion
MTEFTCKACIHAGEPHTFGDSEVVECRCAAVTISGFPIVRADSWCTPGKHDSVANNGASGEEMVDEGEESMHPGDYITMNNGDGSSTVLHVPTTIMNLHSKVKTLEHEVEHLRSRSLWHLIKR